MGEFAQLPRGLHKVVKAFFGQKVQLRRGGDHGFRNNDFAHNIIKAV